MKLSTFALIAGVLAGLWLAACGGAKPRAAAQEPVAGLDHRATHDPRIEDLDRQITEQLEELGLAPPTDMELTEMMVSHSTPALPMADLASSCSSPPAADGCEDVCTTGDLICDNARAICDLASELAGDDWAAQRCAAGQESCDRARERCCGC